MPTSYSKTRLSTFAAITMLCWWNDSIVSQPQIMARPSAPQLRRASEASGPPAWLRPAQDVIMPIVDSDPEDWDDNDMAGDERMTDARMQRWSRAGGGGGG